LTKAKVRVYGGLSVVAEAEVDVVALDVAEDPVPVA
jgi:hypothetical protein